MYNKKDLAQFKFTNGQEVVCDIIEWPDNEIDDIIARNAMAIVMGETAEGDRIYMFRPWVQYLEKNNEFISISTRHIISVNRPNNLLAHEYGYAVQEMHSYANQREEEYKEEMKTQRSITDRIASFAQNISSDSSDKGNIIQFPSPDGTIH